MCKDKKPFYLLLTFIVLLQACNLPAYQAAAPDLGATITAQAGLPQNGEIPTLTPSPDFTNTPEFTPTITETPTPSVPTATVSQNTNCRSGPGTSYDLIGALLIGQSAEVVGKNTPTNYWIIKTPGATGFCWLWGQYATVTGNVAILTEYSIPPTPTPSLPAPVKNLKANKVCVPVVLPTYQYTGSITWVDKSDNEKGFNIYYNGGLFGSVGPNVTDFPIPPLPYPAGTAITMAVESFNDAGKSIKKEVTIICP